MALEALVHEPVQQGAAVVAKGGAGVAVRPELVGPAQHTMQCYRVEQGRPGEGVSGVVTLRTPVHARAVERHKLHTSVFIAYYCCVVQYLVTATMQDKTADLALVALLAKPPAEPIMLAKYTVVQTI